MSTNTNTTNITLEERIGQFIARHRTEPEPMPTPTLDSAIRAEFEERLRWQNDHHNRFLEPERDKL